MTRAAPWPPRFDGASFAERAIALAGCFAERGVQAVAIGQGATGEPGARRSLHAARRTDLPGELAKACPCEVRVVESGDGPAVRYLVTADAITRAGP